MFAASNAGAYIGGGFWIILAIVWLIGFWKVLEKGGESGVWAIFLLTGCLYPFAFVSGRPRSPGGPTWWVILLYIPIVNIVVLAILSIDLAKSFGKGTGYGIGLWLLPLHLLPDARLRLVRLRRPRRARAGLIHQAVGPAQPAVACPGDIVARTFGGGARDRPGRGHLRARGVLTRSTDAHERPRDDRHPGGVRVAGDQHGHAPGRGGPRRPLALRLGVQRLLPREPHRHRGGRHRRRPHAARGPVRCRAGRVRHRARGRWPGADHARARPRPGPAGPRRRGDARHLLRVHRAGLPPRAAAHDVRPDLERLGHPVGRRARRWPGSSARRSAGAGCSSACCRSAG